MNENTRRALEAAGHHVTESAAEAMGLPAWHDTHWEILEDLRRAVREKRMSAGVTQAELARRLGVKQPNIAALEGNDPRISMDAMVRAMLALGATRAELGRAIGNGAKKQAAVSKRMKLAA